MKESKDFLKIVDGSPSVQDKLAFLEALDSVLYRAVFEKDENKKKAYFGAIKEIAKKEGVIPSSIRELYEEMGKNYPAW